MRIVRDEEEEDPCGGWPAPVSVEVESLQKVSRLERDPAPLPLVLEVVSPPVVDSDIEEVARRSRGTSHLGRDPPDGCCCLVPVKWFEGEGLQSEVDQARDLVHGTGGVDLRGEGRVEEPGGVEDVCSASPLLLGQEVRGWSGEVRPGK